MMHNGGLPFKRALILSGGGSKGSFQIGVLKNLVEQGYKWDHITGVSVGAINALFLGMYDKDNQQEGVRALEHLWKSSITGNTSVYKHWLPGPMTYIASFWKGSLFDTTPLRSLIETNIDTKQLLKSNVEVNIGACSLNTGKFKIVDKTHLKILDYVMASSSFPLAFPTIEIDGEMFTDGGIRNTVPYFHLLNSNIQELDVILNNPIEPGVAPEKTSNFSFFLKKAFRIIDILSDEVLVSELHNACNIKGIKLNIYAPEKFFEEHPLNFNSKYIEKLIERGYTITK